MIRKKLQNLLRIIISYVISNRLFLSYVLLSIFGTVALRWSTLGKADNLYPFITDLGLIIMLGSIGYLVKGKKQFRYFFSFILFYTTVEIVNSIYYIFYTSFASFGEISSLSQARTVTGSIFEKFNIWYVIYLLAVIVYFIIHRKLSNSNYYNLMTKVENGKKMTICTFIVGLMFIGLSFACAKKVDYSRLSKQWNRNYIVERFGILLYQGNDFVQSITPKINSLFGLEEAENIFNEYFENRDTSYDKKNKYTGILEGYNIVFVHMEGIQDFTMNLEFNEKSVTPNLNKLASDGMFFTNFYPQISTGTSSDTEFTLLSSLMPASSGTVFVSYYDRNYITLPKLLVEKGYTTFSMHGNYASMWNRNYAHPSLGYQNMYFEESFTYEDDDVINLGINDKLFFEEAIPILENIESENTNYMGTIITLSNHSPFIYLDKYGEYDLSVTYKVYDENTKSYITKTSNYLEGTDMGNYLTSVHYADSALGDLLDYINNSKYFNNTVFVFYGDHDAKLSRKEFNYLYNYNFETGELYNEDDENYVSYDIFDHELNKKTPLIIWTKNKKLKNIFKGEVDYYMGMIDVQPTILNMFGIKNEYALGHDIFNIKDNNVIVYPSGNFLTSMVYYVNSTGEYKILNKNTIFDEDYIEDRKKYTEDLLDISNAIIVYNLLN